jgi:predicted O-methyltransferase YrrM
MNKQELAGFVPFKEDLSGWNGASNVFEQMVALTQPEVIIEVGSWKGQSSVNLAHACKKLGLDTKMYCVDTWLGSIEFREHEKAYGSKWDRMLRHGYPQVYYQFLSNLVHNGVEDMIEPVPNTSKDAVPFVPMADLIYIDADHTYLGVREDLINYWPKVKEGGIIFGDDYMLKSDGPRESDGYQPEVARAVDEFVRANKLSVNILENNFWVIKK